MWLDNRRLGTRHPSPPHRRPSAGLVFFSHIQSLVAFFTLRFVVPSIISFIVRLFPFRESHNFELGSVNLPFSRHRLCLYRLLHAEISISFSRRDLGTILTCWGRIRWPSESQPRT